MTEHEEAVRRGVERIIDSYTFCMVGPHSQDYVSACADDVLAEVVRLARPVQDTGSRTMTDPAHRRRRLWWFHHLPGPLGYWFWITSAHYLTWRRRRA
jgi:hypothetical protein